MVVAVAVAVAVATGVEVATEVAVEVDKGAIVSSWLQLVKYASSRQAIPVTQLPTESTEAASVPEAISMTFSQAYPASVNTLPFMTGQARPSETT